MRLVVNGEGRDLAGELSVSQLLETLDLVRRLVAVEVNREVVPRAEFATRALREGDEVEIVSFVGGG